MKEIANRSLVLRFTPKSPVLELRNLLQNLYLFTIKSKFYMHTQIDIDSSKKLNNSKAVYIIGSI